MKERCCRQLDFSSIRGTLVLVLVLVLLRACYYLWLPRPVVTWSFWGVLLRLSGAANLLWFWLSKGKEPERLAALTQVSVI